ncbi:hypothetical protein [Luteimonas mephitis]|uniref:hypothetical protein n=1 Tax=Luteimonas mephitis TaxID=83615 RepID=UPI003A8D3437
MKINLAACMAAGLLAIMGIAHGADGVDREQQDARVAQFAIPGHDDSSPGFESLSFRSGPRGRGIDYEYGADHKRVRLRNLGTSAEDGGFAVRFPNGLVLDVVPQGDALQVSDRGGKYRKTFEWKYEGPVNGRGTFCQSCVDKPEAIAFVREHFMH